MNNTKKIIGVDIAKRVFQLHWIESGTGEIVSLHGNIYGSQEGIDWTLFRICAIKRLGSN